MYYESYYVKKNSYYVIEYRIMLRRIEAKNDTVPEC